MRTLVGDSAPDYIVRVALHLCALTHGLIASMNSTKLI